MRRDINANPSKKADLPPDRYEQIPTMAPNEKEKSTSTSKSKDY